ncbi:MAG: endopeptidase La [Acidobacteriota bacterium]
MSDEESKRPTPIGGDDGASDPPESDPGDSLFVPGPGDDLGDGGETPSGSAELPILAVRNTVVFPKTVVPLTIGRPKSLAAVQAAMQAKRVLGIVSERPEHADTDDNVDADGVYQVGTWVTIHKMIKIPNGDARVLVQGLSRFRIDSFTAVDPYLRARVDVLDDIEPTPGEDLDALMRSCVSQAEKMIGLSPYLPEELSQAVSTIDDPLHLAYVVASVLKLEVADKQELLELDDVHDKLERVNEAVVRELQVLQIGGKIQSQVATELEKKQKEYFLREQLRAIKEELGEGEDEGGEANELRERLEAADLPEHVLKESLRELSRLEKMHSSSPEYHVIRTYLDWVLAIPWKAKTKDNLDLDNARSVLDEDHHDLEKVKDRLIEYLAVRKLKADHKGPILCFVGPPGVGKTSLGKSIARALGREFQRMSLGGVHDEAEIRGHRRTYVGAMPGRIVQALKRAGSANPVIMLDEVDKVGRDHRGDPSSALLEVLDPEQNSTFRDHYLDLDLDLSRVLFIATANLLDTLQPALRDRMEIIRLPGYATEDKVHIAQNFLLPKQVHEHGIEDVELELEDVCLRTLIAGWTSEAGVRNLERHVATLCRKVATQVAREEEPTRRIEADDLSEYLGPQRVFPEVARRTSVPGVATGLAWTQDGGQVLFVEALKMPGKGDLVLTGQLGEVMQESARTALSHVRSVHAELGIDEKQFKQHDVHVHVPAGAIPKDGPSAGVAIATAIASVFSGRRVMKSVAMTGELTLTGQVLPVGGVREKVLAARRAGIDEVLLPFQVEAEVEEIPAEYREGMQFHYLEKLRDAFERVFVREDDEPNSSAESSGRKRRSRLEPGSVPPPPPA